MTTLTASATPLVELNVDAIVIGVHSGDDGLVLGPGAAEVDTALNGKLLEILYQLGARGSADEVTRFVTFGATTAPVVAAVGLGADNHGDTNADLERLRRASGAAIRALSGTARVGLGLGHSDGLQAIADGAMLAAYDFTKYKAPSDSRKVPVTSITITADPKARETKALIKRATVLAESVHTARDWINTPPNDLRPPDLAEQAAAVASKAGLSVEVLDEKALKKGGYGGILAVGNGSTAAPRLVRLQYTARGARKHIALIGKGITFDTGGISIKPSQGMQEMKSDMSGAATVVGAMLAIAALKPKVTVTAYVPLAENMPSGSAYRPGDVVTMYGGKKVEILNTDAEGRIVLGDAIARACEDEPDFLFETSTLTGGQVVALGKRISGVMGSDGMPERVQAAGQRTGEPMWPMPLPDDVRSSMDSPIADLLQISAGFDRAGHMLQGGVFLSEFVAEGVEWAHIDIAGPSYNSATPHGYTPKGGTGVPLRTLVDLVETIADEG